MNLSKFTSYKKILSGIVVKICYLFITNKGKLQIIDVH